MGEIVGIDGWVEGGVGGGDVYATAGEWMLENCKHREVITWVRRGVRREESAGVTDELWSKGAGEEDFLGACFARVEELLEDERVLL